MSTPIVFAADVAKAHLVIRCYPPGQSALSIRNDRQAIATWLRSLPAGSIVGMEATGSYHRLLAELAYAAGMRVYVLNPRDVYYYARGIGARAKTDPQDAGVIARYLAREYEHLHPFVPASPTSAQLTTLLDRRATLVRTRGALALSLADVDCLQAGARRLLKELDALIAAVDAQLRELIAQDPRLQPLYARLHTITGIGPLTGTMLTALFTRVPFANAQALVAYLGLDPRPDQSGRHEGRRRLSKRGHPEWRRLLVAAAMSAARTALWKSFVTGQRAKGLPSTAVHVILARKLARIAFSLFKSQQTFDPQRYMPTCQTP